MVRAILPIKRYGFVESAAKAAAQARKKHRERRRTIPAKIIKKNLNDLKTRTLAELKNPLNWINPMKVFVIWPINSSLAVLGFVTSTWLGIINDKKAQGLWNERKSSLLIKKSASTIVAYAIAAEMEQDKAYKEQIKNLVKSKGLEWISVDKKGQVILTKHQKKNSTSINIVFEMSKAEFAPATTSGNLLPGLNIVAIRTYGSEIHIYDPAARSAARPLENPIRIIKKKEVIQKSIANISGAPKRKLIVIATTAGVQMFNLLKEDAEKLYKTMG